MKMMEENGIRVQKSFFQCDISESSLDILILKLRNIMNEKKDSLFVYPICNKCESFIDIVGKGTFFEKASYIIL